MSKDLSSGKLNINKLLGNVQGMVKDLSKDISPDVDPTGFIPNMLNDETMGILKKLFDAKGEPIHIVYNQVFKPSASDKGK
jgi:hypothetical protein